jgi:hypothetical protein
VFTEQISAALIRHRQLIEQLANALYKPGDLRVFVDSDQLTREVETPCVMRPKVPLRARFAEKIRRFIPD